MIWESNLARIALLGAAMVLGVVGPAYSQSFDDAYLAYERGEFETALHGFRPLAEQGDALAQFNVGTMYYFGTGIERDYSQAVHWFKQAALQGVTLAQFNVAYIYYMGRGHIVEQDYVEAVKWLSMAAEQGHAHSQFLLGISYYKGRGVPNDPVQAHMWLALAGAQGHQEAHVATHTAESFMTRQQVQAADEMAEAKAKAKGWEFRTGH